MLKEQASLLRTCQLFSTFANSTSLQRGLGIGYDAEVQFCFHCIDQSTHSYFTLAFIDPSFINYPPFIRK